MIWQEFREQIEFDHDLQEESMIDANDLKAWANEAIEDAEEVVHIETEGDYFETDTTIDLVSGQAEYDAPTDLYANKFEELFYMGGERPYEINEVKKNSAIIESNPEDCYQYKIKNTPTGIKIVLYPTPDEDLTAGLKLFYIRKATKIVNDSSVVDIPEALGFIRQYISDKIINKEQQTLNAPESQALKRKRESLKLTLQKQTHNDDNLLEVDMTLHCLHR